MEKVDHVVHADEIRSSALVLSTPHLFLLEDGKVYVLTYVFVGGAAVQPSHRKE